MYPDLELISLCEFPNPRQITSFTQVKSEIINYLILVELKRSPSRRFLSNPSPDAGTLHQGRNAVAQHITKAMQQVELQAAAMYRHSLSQTTNIILIAGAGPFWSFVEVSKTQIVQTIEPDLDAAALIELHAMGKEEDMQEEAEVAVLEELEGQEAVEEAAVPLVIQYYENLIPALADIIDDTSRLRWSSVMVLNTPTSDSALSKIRSNCLYIHA